VTLSSVIYLVVVVCLAWIYDLINGMNDCANSIATTVSTRALRPFQAVLLAAILNIIGALITTEVAKTIGKGIVDPKSVTGTVLVSSLIGANLWAGLATHFGIPISITHSLVGGILGAGIFAKGLKVVNIKGVTKIFWAMIISPIAGFISGLFLMFSILWIFRKVAPDKLTKLFRNFQIVSASFMALSHGMNDTQNAMGIITATLVSLGFLPEFKVPLWVILGSAFFMGLGTFLGGWRVIKTMGMKIVKLRTPHGFSAETSSALVIIIASLLGLPISTTHVISTAIMGVGATEKLSAVKWGVAFHIVLTWIFTIPGAAVFAGLTYKVLSLLGL
jgi:PiT family inorganic phosphate transporter